MVPMGLHSLGQLNMSSLHIRFDRERLMAGSPCVSVDDQWWGGFETTRGVAMLRSTDGQAWIDWDGDIDWITEGGLVIEPNSEVESYGFNMFPVGQLERIRSDHSLVFGAVNRPRVIQRRPAVTIYRWQDNTIVAACVDEARFEGRVRTIVVTNPTDPRPLNVWIETNDYRLVEF